TSIPQSTASVPDPAPVAVRPGGPSDVSFGEQNLSFTTTDISLVELMEVEYTQLQHVLYSHVEAQASGGEVEARLSSFSLPDNSADLPLHQTPLNTGQEECSSSSSGNQLVYPGICQSGLPSDSSLQSSNPHLSYADIQELRMMLRSECNLPLNPTERTPNSGSVEVPGHSLIKAEHREDKENILIENLALAPEPRPKSAVRVRLEDRFNSIPTETPRCQEPRESGVTHNNLVSLVQQPSELAGVPFHQQENKRAAIGKTKSAPAMSSLPLSYPVFAMNACSAGTAPAQTSGKPCAILEAAGHQDLGIPKTLAFCYQEVDSTKQTGAAMNKALPEELWNRVGEDTLSKQVITRRSCSQTNPLDPNSDRKPLGELQNLRADSQSGASAAGPWQAAQTSSGMQVQGGTQDPGMVQRRERHNRLERDRRRRIRLCCDELNLLVPFCTIDTDKATTLQWTTAFLKYIQERHGDSLKQEFETVFCGKTGRRLKVASSDSFVTCPVQENTHGYGEQV
ncbi:TCFL5 protein, partial [Bucorvus abyssinicus]|nr:TCFL5 protein [Bucorvus abyssinicus]